MNDAKYQNHTRWLVTKAVLLSVAYANYNLLQLSEIAGAKACLA